MSIKYPGKITDIKGIKVGHAQNDEAGTGVTAVIFEEGFVCSCDVRGSAPGTRETALLGQAKTVDKVNGIALCGGSAFGLDAAGGLMQFLEEKGQGFDTGYAVVPVVPACVIYDLAYKSSKIRPTKEMGYEACRNLAVDFRQGSFGAGTGATVGKVLGAEFSSKGGIGSASIYLAGGIIVSALMVVNAYGDILDDGEIIAGAVKDGEFINSKKYMLENSGVASGFNTTIGIVATNAALTKDEAAKLAQMGQNGICESISPAHTVFDGDTVFAVATGEKKCDLHFLTAAAQEAARRSIVNAVLSLKED